MREKIKKMMLEKNIRFESFNGISVLLTKANILSISKTSGEITKEDLLFLIKKIEKIGGTSDEI